MQSMFCVNCSQPLPAGAAFCGNCGASQKPASPNATAYPAPTQASSAQTVRAAAPPSGADYAPTQLQPPPAPGSLAGQDAYAAQYIPPPPPPPYTPYGGPGDLSGAYSPTSDPYGPIPPPPAYAPGPPPAYTPAGGVAPWAQAPKKRNGLKIALVGLVLLVLLAGGGYLLIKALSSKGGSTASQATATAGVGATPGAGNTPGAGSTPGSGATPGGNPPGTQTLDNINRQAIYAGVTITILSAKQASSLPERQESDPSLNALEVQVKASNQTDHTVYPTIQVFDAAGDNYMLATSSPAAFGLDWMANTVASGALLFDVPATSKVSDFQIQFGNSQELPVPIPLTGAYDPTQWQPVTHQVNQTIVYENGGIKYTVTQVVTTTWTPGYQAPKGTRFLEMYLHVENNTAIGIDAGEGTPPVYLLVFPNGDRSEATSNYGGFIDTVVGGGESKDVGYDTFLIPPTPTPGLMMVFLFADGSVAGKVDMGTF